MKNISDEHNREYQNTYSIFNFVFENCVGLLYEIMWKNDGRARRATDDNII